MEHMDKLEGIIGIIDDGIKDAWMQCDWACKAHDSGDREAEAMFKAEAHKRISGAKEWLDKHREMMLDPKNAETVAAVFVHRLDDKIAHATAKMNVK
jgi:hypothetical protein